MNLEDFGSSVRDFIHAVAVFFNLSSEDSFQNIYRFLETIILSRHLGIPLEPGSDGVVDLDEINKKITAILERCKLDESKIN